MNNNEIEKITCLEGMPDLNTLSKIKITIIIHLKLYIFF